MLKALLFDLDGTLVDTRLDLHASVNHALGRHGLPPLSLEEVCARVGNGARILIRACLPPSAPPGLEDAALADFLSHYAEHCADRAIAYPGALEALQELGPRHTLAVLTNKPQLPTEKILAALGLRGYFDQVLGGDGPLGKKPDPAGLLHVLERLGARPAEAALIGDGVQDLECARAAGCAFVAMLGGIGPREPLLRLHPGPHSEGFAGLRAALQALGDRAREAA